MAVSSRESLGGVSSEGRSYYFGLKRSDYLRYEKKTFTAIKIKSVTDNGAPPIMESYVASAQDRVIQPTHRFNIDSAGRIRITPARQHPRGTEYLSDAINEYTVMGKAFWGEIPTGYPVGIGSFTGLSFMGEPVGFTVIALETLEETRISLILEKNNDDILRAGSIEKFRTAFDFLNSMAKSSARILRDMHNQGIIHSNPYLYNYGRSSSGRIYVHDFSDGKLAGDISRDEFRVRVFNDFRHLYFSTFNSMVQGADPEQVELIMRSFKLPSPIENAFGVESTDGYFSKNAARRIGEDKIRSAISLKNFMGFILNFWNEQNLVGRVLSPADHPSIEVLFEFANSIYDRVGRR